MPPFKILDARTFPLWQMEAFGSFLIREEDKTELESLTGESAGVALSDSVKNNNDGCWIAISRYSDKIAAVFGKEKQDAVPGRIIWMVGTPELHNCVLPFLVTSKLILDHWLEKYGTLHNMIDLRNATHIHWLTTLGFELPPNMTCQMQDGAPFQYFYKEK